MKLSAYTIAKNCTDTHDTKLAYDELMARALKSGYVPAYVYTRLARIIDKHKRLSAKEIKKGLVPVSL